MVANIAKCQYCKIECLIGIAPGPEQKPVCFIFGVAGLKSPLSLAIRDPQADEFAWHERKECARIVLDPAQGSSSSLLVSLNLTGDPLFVRHRNVSDRQHVG